MNEGRGGNNIWRQMSSRVSDIVFALGSYQVSLLVALGLWAVHYWRNIGNPVIF
jgi:hypothetical protein